MEQFMEEQHKQEIKRNRRTILRFNNTNYKRKQQKINNEANKFIKQEDEIVKEFIAKCNGAYNNPTFEHIKQLQFQYSYPITDYMDIENLLEIECP